MNLILQKKTRLRATC